MLGYTGRLLPEIVAKPTKGGNQNKTATICVRGPSSVRSLFPKIHQRQRTMAEYIQQEKTINPPSKLENNSRKLKLISSAKSLPKSLLIRLIMPNPINGPIEMQWKQSTPRNEYSLKRFSSIRPLSSSIFRMRSRIVFINERTMSVSFVL